MNKHTALQPASQLPIERTSNGALLMAGVECVEQGPQTKAEDKAGDRRVCIDFTRSHFEIAVTVTGRRYSAIGEWGSTTLSEVCQALARDGYRLHCCFNCRYFWPSGMIDEWSFGAEGLCIRGEVNEDEPTHMLHICQYWTQDKEPVDDSKRVQLVSLYQKAYSAISADSQATDDVFRARTLNPVLITSEDFIREYAWVVFVSGFKVEVVRERMPRLKRIFKNWSPEAISQDRLGVRSQALQVLRNPRKVDAVLQAVDFVNKQGWAAVENAILRGMVRTRNGCYPSAHFFDYISNAYDRKELSWMGPTNRRYLAKNLGFDLAKNDRHLTRLATQYEYQANADGVQHFVEDIARCVDERVSVVETILWNACKAGAI